MAKEPELHSMPCKIHGDDSANVATHFKPYIKNIDDECEYFEIYFDFYNVLLCSWMFVQNLLITKVSLQIK